MARTFALLVAAALMVAAIPSAQDFSDAQSRGAQSGRSGRNAPLVAGAPAPAPSGCRATPAAPLPVRSAAAERQDVPHLALIDATPGRGMG